MRNQRFLLGVFLPASGLRIFWFSYKIGSQLKTEMNQSRDSWEKRRPCWTCQAPSTCDSCLWHEISRAGKCLFLSGLLPVDPLTVRTYGSAVTNKLHTRSVCRKTDSLHIWIYMFDILFTYAAGSLSSPEALKCSPHLVDGDESKCWKKGICLWRASPTWGAFKRVASGAWNWQKIPTASLSASASSLVKSQTAAWRTLSERDPFLIQCRRGNLERGGWRTGETRRRMESGWMRGGEDADFAGCKSKKEYLRFCSISKSSIKPIRSVSLIMLTPQSEALTSLTCLLPLKKRFIRHSLD